MITAKSVYETCRWLTVGLTLASAALGATSYVAYNVMENGRRLSARQIATITEKLKFVSKPPRAISVSRPPHNEEATDVGDAIKKALVEAGFKIDGVWPGDSIGSDPIGILVRRNNDDAMLGNALADAFRSVNLSVELVSFGDSDRQLDIVIGRKPPY